MDRQAVQAADILVAGVAFGLIDDYASGHCRITVERCIHNRVSAGIAYGNVGTVRAADNLIHIALHADADGTGSQSRWPALCWR